MKVMQSSVPHLIPYLIVAFIYMAVALDFWRVAKQALPLNESVMPFQLHRTVVALAIALHGWLLYQDIFAVGALNLGVYFALSAIMWLTVLIYWLADFKYTLQSLQAFMLPIAALCVLMPAFAIKDYYVDTQGVSLFSLHIAIAMLAYSLFTFAAMHACLMTVAERALHQKNTWLKNAWFKFPAFPPLMIMETLLFKMIALGFVLLTVTLLSGMLFSEEIFGKALQLNHKTIFSIASWLIYGALLFGRYRYGWRGKKAIRWTQIGFVLLLLAYIGSRFVLHVILNR